MRARPLAAALLLLAGPAAGATGSLRGHVQFRGAPPSEAPRPAIAELGAPAAAQASDDRVAVVYLDVGPRGAFEDREGPHAVLDQRHETFVPHVLAVSTGTVVDFPNDDSTYHNVFSLSRTKTFDLGRYPRGESKSVRFDRPGIVRVFCEIHSHMNAFILVFAHRFFALTGAGGDYRISGVPPGTYSVSVWHPSRSAPPQTVTIPEDGGETELDFSLP